MMIWLRILAVLSGWLPLRGSFDRPTEIPIIGRSHAILRIAAVAALQRESRYPVMWYYTWLETCIRVC